MPTIEDIPTIKYILTSTFEQNWSLVAGQSFIRYKNGVHQLVGVRTPEANAISYVGFNQREKMYNTCAVEVKNLVKRYGENQILKELSMRIERGQIYGLLGASGCGKSTLINCLVGRNKIDKGEIRILGQQPGYLGSKIGYMPQELALVGEFTIKDSIYYFGRIFHMKESVIAKRFLELQALLELPPADRYVKNCSGGEQRRVSCAVALVHEPELLIMDEPTVGMESLLRHRIWDHLLNITRTYNTSIILTTHYLEECKNADKIGLMRNGKLLAEDSPTQILKMYNCRTLEEAFFILSRNQEEKLNYGEYPLIRDECVSMEVVGYKTPTEEGHSKNGPVEILKRKKRNSILNRNRLLALMDKNWKQFHRNFLNLIFLVLLPVLQQVIFMNTLGRAITNIPLGIVNDEGILVNCSEFSITRSVTVSGDVSTSSCHFQNMSCRFLEYLDDPMIRKINYDTVMEANEDLKLGSLIGVVNMYRNFTENLEKRMWSEWSADEAVLDSSQVKVWLDMSSLRVGGEVQIKLQQLFMKFLESVYVDCGLSSKLTGTPIDMNFVYGRPGEEYIVNMIPSGMVTAIFFIGAIMTSQVIVKERSEGIWDRSIVAGVTSLEIIVTHFVMLASLSVIHVLGIFLVTYIAYQQEYAGSLLLMYCIVYLQSICGVTLGFLISVVATDHTMATLLVSGILFPMMMLNGLLWPIQGMPDFLAFIAKCLPFTLATESLRNVSKKGWSLGDAKVINGIAISSTWTIFFVVMSVYLMRKRG